MTEEIDAIMFDAGGTLIDVRPSKQEIFARILSEHDLHAKPEKIAVSMAKADRQLDTEFAEMDGKDEPRFWQRYDDLVLADLGIKSHLKEISKDLSRSFQEIMQKTESWTEYPDVRPALERLRRRDFKVGVVSNATDLLNKVFQNLDLSRYFDFVIISDEVGVRKPSPEIFMMAAEEAGTSPSRSLYLGDKPAVDIKGATRAGMNAILVDRANAFPDASCIRIRDLTYLKRFS
jgi:REG-2-like HAD superfamily hydrolase